MAHYPTRDLSTGGQTHPSDPHERPPVCGSSWYNDGSRAHGRKKLGIAAIWDDAPAFVDVYPFCVNHPFRRTVVTICSDGSAPEDYRVAAQQQAMEI